MDQLNILYCCIFGVTGLLMIGLSLPLLQGKIKKNYWYGFRLPKAFESEENWYAINRYGAQRLINWSILFFILSLCSLVIPFNTNPSVALIVGFSPLFIILIPIIKVLQFAKKL